MAAAPRSRSPEVDAYIASAPAAARAKLTEIRRIVRATFPSATERISYRLPGYGFPGYAREGMFAWFGLQKRHIGLYLRPPTIARHHAELAGYGTTKSAVHLPLDEDLPAGLLRKLLRASARFMRERDAPPAPRRATGRGRRRRAGNRRPTRR